MNDLIALAERVEKATGPDRDLDGFIAVSALDWTPPFKIGVCGPHYSGRDDYEWHTRDGKARGFEPPPFTSSLDAAMTLVPSWACPHLRWNADEWKWGCQLENTLNIPFNEYRGLAATLPLALTAACLRARAAQETKG